MGKFKLTNKAVGDLSEIWEYTYEVWSEIQADKYYELLIEACKTIAESPGIGKRYDAIFPALLGYPAYRHVVFYQAVSKNEVLIVRILHERMDLKNQINEDEG